MKVVHCLEMIDAKDVRSRLMLAEGCRFIGQCSGELHLDDQSCDYFRRAYETICSTNDDHCLSRATFDFGRSLIRKKNFAEAMKIFKEILSKTTTDHERTLICQILSEISLEMNEVDQAKNFAYQAFDWALASNDDYLCIQCERLLGEISLRLKDFSRAEEYFRHLQQMKDELGDLTDWKEFDWNSSTESNRNRSRQWKFFNPFDQWCRNDSVAVGKSKSRRTVTSNHER